MSRIFGIKTLLIFCLLHQYVLSHEKGKQFNLNTQIGENIQNDLNHEIDEYSNDDSLTLQNAALTKRSGNDEKDGAVSLLDKYFHNIADQNLQRQRKEAEKKKKNKSNGKRKAVKKSNKNGNKGKKKINKKRKDTKKKKQKKNKKKSGKKNKRKNKSKKRGEGKQKKKEKQKKKKMSKQRKNKTQRQDNCVIKEACIESALSYMNILRARVKNYNKQFKRIERQNRTANNKLKKINDFKVVMNQVAVSAGGDPSNLVCGKNANNSGANLLQDLTSGLGNCDVSIGRDCDVNSLVSKPLVDILECNKKVEAFSEEALACTELVGTEACECWTSDKLANLKSDFSSCTLVSDADSVAMGIQKCLASFGQCRKLEDSVGQAIHACDQDISELLAKLKRALLNQKALNDAVATLKQIQVESTTETKALCSDIIEFVKQLPDIILQCPLTNLIEVTAEKIALSATSRCSVEEKEAIDSLTKKIETSVSVFEEIQLDLQSTITMQRGSNATLNEIESAGSYSGEFCIQSPSTITTTATEKPTEPATSTTSTTSLDVSSTLSLLKRLSENKGYAESVKTSVDGLIGSKRNKRIITDCASAMTLISSFVEQLYSNKVGSDLSSISSQIVISTTILCTTDQLSTLSTYSNQLDFAIKQIDLKISELQNDLLAQTGSTASPDTLSSAEDCSFCDDNNIPIQLSTVSASVPTTDSTTTSAVTVTTTSGKETSTSSETASISSTESGTTSVVTVTSTSDEETSAAETSTVSTSISTTKSDSSTESSSTSIGETSSSLESTTKSTEDQETSSSSSANLSNEPSTASDEEESLEPTQTSSTATSKEESSEPSEGSSTASNAEETSEPTQASSTASDEEESLEPTQTSTLNPESSPSSIEETSTSLESTSESTEDQKTSSSSSANSSKVPSTTANEEESSGPTQTSSTATNEGETSKPSQTSTVNPETSTSLLNAISTISVTNSSSISQNTSSSLTNDTSQLISQLKSISENSQSISYVISILANLTSDYNASNYDYPLDTSLYEDVLVRREADECGILITKLKKLIDTLDKTYDDPEVGIIVNQIKDHYNSKCSEVEALTLIKYHNHLLDSMKELKKSENDMKKYF